MVLSFSSDAFSAEHTGRILALLVRWTGGALSPTAFAVLHAVLRKGAHVTEYGILALLYFRAWRGAAAGWAMAYARRALAVVIAMAGVDEFHQSLTRSRGSSALDVLLDAIAAAVCLAIVGIALRRKTRGDVVLVGDSRVERGL